MGACMLLKCHSKGYIQYRFRVGRAADRRKSTIKKSSEDVHSSFSLGHG